MARSSCAGPPGAESRADRPRRAPFLYRRGGHRLYAAVYDPLTAPLEKAVLGGHRSAFIAGLSGLVLDLGAGTGANLAHFRSAREVVAAEPGPWMRQRLAAKPPVARSRSR